MTKVNFHTIEEIEDEKIRFVVTAARYQDKWLFCRHKQRTTWDMPGGRREPGETALEGTNRELWEETGAAKSETTPVCIYSVTKENVTTYGLLCYSNVESLGPLPAEFEMEEILLTDRLPENLTYPDIQPELFSLIQGWLNLQSNPGELWDVYDENRVKTGRLHRRGDYLKPGEYHLVVHVWMRNRQGKFLITKRAPNKGFPNMWESTGGSALSGDDSLTAAIREVKEETGLTLCPERGQLVMSERKSDYFRDVWLFCQDFALEDVVLQPGETTDCRWADWEEITAMYNKGDFVPYDYLDKLRELTRDNIAL